MQNTSEHIISMEIPESVNPAAPADDREILRLRKEVLTLEKELRKDAWYQSVRGIRVLLRILVWAFHIAASALALLVAAGALWGIWLIAGAVRAQFL